MNKVKKAITWLVEWSKIDVVVSAIYFVACMIMLIILGTVATICAMVENLCTEKIHNKKERE